MFSLCKDFEDLSLEERWFFVFVFIYYSSATFVLWLSWSLSYAVGHILLGAILLMRKYELFYRAASPLFGFITIPVV